MLVLSHRDMLTSLRFLAIALASLSEISVSSVMLSAVSICSSSSVAFYNNGNFSSAVISSFSFTPGSNKLVIVMLVDIENL